MNSLKPISEKYFFSDPESGQSGQAWQSQGEQTTLVMVSGSAANLSYGTSISSVTEKIFWGAIGRIEQELTTIRTDIERLADSMSESAQSQIVPIVTFAPEPYKVVNPPLFVTVRPTGDGEFIAAFFDAGISITADSAEEAVDELKHLLLHSLERLTENEQRLGVHPKRQLGAIRSVIVRQG